MKLLKSLTLVLFVMLICSADALGQRYSNRKGSVTQLGVSLGSSTFWGDLGGSRGVGRPFVRDFELAVTRPAVGAYFIHNFSHVLGVRLNAYYTQVTGDDALTNADNPGDLGYARKYRNLSFRSNIFEVSTMLDINLLPYIPGNERFPFTIYVTGGIGGIYYNPQTQYNGDWIDLQPLGTEGQGLPQYPGKEKYSNFALAFPLGAGIKYNFSDNVTLTFEISHRLTTTDYIDDVSTYYPNPDFIRQAYDDNLAELVIALSDRSFGDNPSATAPGQQRGDPSDFDGYTYMGIFTMSFVLRKKGNTQLYCPVAF